MYSPGMWTFKAGWSHRWG